MKKYYLLTLLLCFQVNAKIYTIEDLKLKKPQGKSLRERIAFTVIYGGDFNKNRLELNRALDENKISSILYYQMMNLINKNKNFNINYYEDESLKDLKLSLLNLGKKTALENLIKKKENNQFISDLIIKDTFENKNSLLKDSVFKLKTSPNLDILLIKINYAKTIFNESV